VPILTDAGYTRHRPWTSAAPPDKPDGTVVDEVLATFGTLTKRGLDAVAALFDRLTENPKELKKVKSFYDIEDERKSSPEPVMT
jgi:hypothetical protein